MLQFISETDCATCGVYFDRMYKQHEHARITGHKRSEYCMNKFRTLRCAREKFHPGACEAETYGGQSSSFFPSPLQRAMRPVEKKAGRLMHDGKHDEAVALLRIEATRLATELGYDLSDGWIVESAVEKSQEELQ